LEGTAEIKSYGAAQSFLTETLKALSSAQGKTALSQARKRRDNSEFITHAECAQMMEPVKEQMEKIMEALVGKDLGRIGGIVGEIADIKGKLASILSELTDEKKKKSGSRRQFTSFAYAVLGGLIVVVATYGLQHL
jgi:tRNA(Glu) U13 pseudouridine synthase TruD